MAKSHPGSLSIGNWRLPDYGITEGVSDFLFGKGARTGSNTGGGSNLIQDKYQNPIFADLNKTGNNIPLQELQSPSVRGINTEGVTNSSANDKVISRQNNQQPSGGSGKSPFPADQYVGWDPTAAQQDWNAKQAAGQAGGGGGQNQDLVAMLNESYAPYLSQLAGYEQDIQNLKGESVTNVDKTFAEGEDSINRQKSELEAGLSRQEKDIGAGQVSAWADATRRYNNLVNQALNRFGGSGTTAQAIQGILARELQRGGGQIRQTAQKGLQDVGMERTKMQNYIADKTLQLGQWQRSAMADIDANFTKTLNEIGMDRGRTEGEKTRAKLEILQDTVNRAREIKQKGLDFQQNLARWSIEQLAESKGRTLTVKEMSDTYNAVMAQSFTPGTVGGQTPVQSNPYSYKAPGEEDELSKLGTTR